MSCGKLKKTTKSRGQNDKKINRYIDLFRQ